MILTITRREINEKRILHERNAENRTATVAINNLGKLTQKTVELRGEDDNPYFEYGVMNDNIYIDEFEFVGGDAA